MLTFICFVCLVIVILAIYQFRKNDSSATIEDFRNMNPDGWNLYWYGVPSKPKENTAYISVICDDYLDIYVDRGGKANPVGKSPARATNMKFFGRARCCGWMYKFTINNLNKGDKIFFYNLNTGGPGYWAGQLFYNGKLIPFNASNIKPESYQGPNDYYRRSGKYLGCFRDQGSRRLPYWGFSTGSFEQCQELAQRRGHKYFGTQYGGECWTGWDWRRATSAGRASCNRMRTRARGNIGWTQPYGLGQAWTQAIYSTRDVFDVSNGWNLSWKWFRNKNERGRWTRFRDGVYAIKPKVAGGWRQFPYGRWQLYSYTIPMTIQTEIDFCPDKEYTEFNAAGCRDPSNAWTCTNSANRPNYVPNQKLCVNKFNVSNDNFDNNGFFKVVETALKISLAHTKTLNTPIYLKGWNRAPGSLVESDKKTKVKLSINGRWNKGISKEFDKPGTYTVDQSKAYSTDSNCGARDKCIVQVNNKNQVRIRLLDRCKSAQGRYSYSNYIGAGGKVEKDGCAITKVTIEKPKNASTPKSQIIGIGKLDKVKTIALPRGINYLENTVYDSRGNEVKGTAPVKLQINLSTRKFVINPAEKSDNSRYSNFRNKFLHIINICCAILNWKDAYVDLNQCISKGWSFDMGYLNDLIKQAREQSDKHAMKDGKKANTFNRIHLDSAIKELLDEARILIGQHLKECGCADFEKVNIYTYQGRKYCSSYQSFVRHRGVRSASQCQRICNNLQGCNAIGIGEHCITYHDCRLSNNTQNWKWYTYYRDSRGRRRRRTHYWYYYNKSFGASDGQELTKNPKCKPC